jgi:anti-sigma factor RsiW
MSNSRIRSLFSRTPTECARVGRVLQEYLDSELDAETASQVLSHLEECRHCGLEAETYRRIKDSIGRQSQPDAAATDRLRNFAERLIAGEIDPSQLDADDEV